MSIHKIFYNKIFYNKIKLNLKLKIVIKINYLFSTGDKAVVRNLSLKSLLPDTNNYMTYEGSTTHPGCWETTIWLILNKPIYITAQEVRE